MAADEKKAKKKSCTAADKVQTNYKAANELKTKRQQQRS